MTKTVLDRSHTLSPEALRTERLEHAKRQAERKALEPPTIPPIKKKLVIGPLLIGKKAVKAHENDYVPPPSLDPDV